MDNMFRNSLAFNQNISGWDTSGVIEMNGMFYEATAFDQDLSGWCVELIGSVPTDDGRGCNISACGLMFAENSPSPLIYN
jgi:surface protein